MKTKFDKLTTEQYRALYAASVTFCQELAAIGIETELDYELKWLIIDTFDKIMLYMPLARFEHDPVAEVQVDDAQITQLVDAYYRGGDVFAMFPVLMWLHKTDDDIHERIWDAMAKYNDTHPEWCLTNWLSSPIAV